MFRARSMILLFGFVAVVCALICAAQAQDEQDGQLTEDQKLENLESFDYVWEAIRDQYWDPETGGLDWNAVRDELRPEIEAADSRLEARQVLRRLVNRLEVSHFGCSTSKVFISCSRRSNGN